jgi:uncharacterized protein YjbI with pentapeptide repeats
MYAMSDDELTWRPAIPDVDGVEPTPADACAGLDEPLELSRVSWLGQRLVAVDLDHPEVADVSAAECDFSGLTVSGGVLRRLRIRDSRLRDCTFAGGIIQDTTIESCGTERLSLRFATLQRVVVTGSALPGLDLYGATFDRVLFRDCDLSGAAFDGVTVKQLRLERCGLAGVTGALSLRGAEVDVDDLMSLGPSLAREAGLRLR